MNRSFMKSVYSRLLKRICLGYTEEEVPKEVYKEIDNDKWKAKVMLPNNKKVMAIAFSFLKYSIILFVLDLYLKGYINLFETSIYFLKTAGFFLVGALLLNYALRVSQKY